MSIQALSHVWRDASVTSQSDLLVLLAIADFANDNGEAWPSIDTIAFKSRHSRRGVQNVVRRLIEAKKLIVIPMGGMNGTSLYRMTFMGCTGCTGGGAFGGPPNAPDPSGTVSTLSSDQNLLTLEGGTGGNLNAQCTGCTPEEQVYEAYPFKVGKGAALPKIRAALTKIPFDQLLTLTKQYAKMVKEANYKFVPNPSTWFHQQRYADDPSTWVRKGSNGVSDGQKLKLLQEQIDQHPANRESVYHNERMCTPEKRQELKELIHKLANLKRTVIQA